MARLFDDSSNEYLAVSGSPVSSVPFTLAAWARTDAEANQTILSIGESSGTAYWAIQFRYDFERHMQAQNFQTGDGIDVLRDPNYALNTWHHTAAIFTSTTSEVFLDGYSDGTTNSSLTSITEDSVTIGVSADSTPYGYLSGEVAHAAIWSTNLTDAEMSQLSMGASPLLVRPDNLVAYWPLLRTDQDLVGGYDMTAYNSPTWSDHPAKIWYPPAAMNGLWLPEGGAGSTVNVSFSNLVSAGEQAGIQPGSVGIGVGEGSLGVYGEAAGISSVKFIQAGPAELSGGVQAGTILPGQTTILGGVGSLISAGEQAALSPGAVVIVNTAGEITGEGQTVLISPGAVSILGSIQDLTGAGQAVSVSPGVVLITISSKGLLGSVVSPAVSPGLAEISVSVGGLTFSGEVPTITVGNYVAVVTSDLLSASLSSEIIPGAVSLSATLADLISAGEPAHPNVSVVISSLAAGLGAGGLEPSVIPGGVSVETVVQGLSVNFLPGAVVPGSVSLLVGVVELLASGLTGSTFTGRYISVGVTELVTSILSGTVSASTLLTVRLADSSAGYGLSISDADTFEVVITDAG